MKTAITARLLFTPLQVIEHPVVLIEDGRITALGSRSAMAVPAGVQHFDFPDQVLAPGFIDIHVHGGSGHDVMEIDVSALSAIEQGMAKHGVTSYLPTTVTAPIEQTLRSLEHLGRSIRDGGPRTGRAVPLGIHLEGPFISHAKCGVHPTDHLLRPSPELLRRFHQASQETARIVTIAPELEGSLSTIAEAKALGIISSLGHSDANLQQTKAAIQAGATHATHTFNAMRALDHREPGILGAVLSDDRVTADLIADGIHVAPEVVKLFLRAKGPDGAILITDAISATGMPNGTYKLGGFDVEVKNGRCELNGKLAGSVLTLDRAVRNLMDFASIGLMESVKLATLNPARLLGIDHERGMLAAGMVADMVVLSTAGEVVQTMMAGETG
jgi:N-acetylglucosamine-6-phosphate deacetylase